MSSIAEYRRVLEIEGRLDALQSRLADYEEALNRLDGRVLEIEVRLDTPRPQPQPNNTQRRA